MKPVRLPVELAKAAVAFALALVFLVFAAAPLQMRYGMAGLLLTELGLLALALVAAFVGRDAPGQVFPWHAPRLREVFGALLMWLGSYIVVMLAALITQLLFPQQMTEVAVGMGNLFATVPLWAQLLIVAVCPALCEEMLFRGYLLHRLRPLPLWTRATVCGVLFGAFHLDPLRFLPTAILGVAISWAVLQSRSLFPGMLMHFFNNGLSVLATLALDQVAYTEIINDATTVEAAITVQTLGAYLFLCGLSPWLLWAGTYLVKPKGSPTGDRARTAFVCLVVSAACLGGGSLLVMRGM